MNEIYQTIPHRPPFLFLDEIVEVTEEKAVGRRKIRAEEPHFSGHYPGNPIMPGVLLCEAVFQTGAVLLVKRLQVEGEGEIKAGYTPILSRIHEAKFKSMVRPGEVITIEAIYKRCLLKKFFNLSGTVRKENGKLALRIGFTLALIKEETESK